MAIDVDYDEQQRAFAEVVTAFCGSRKDTLDDPGDVRLPELWGDLAELGVLGLGTEEVGGGPSEVAAVMECLGAAGFPGPLAATLLAVQVLPSEQRAQVVSGQDLVAVGVPPLLPWGTRAAVYIEVDLSRRQVWLAEPAGELTPVEVTGGSVWAHGSLRRVSAERDAAAALVTHDVSRAAYLAGLGRRLVDVAVEHAKHRVQFGRPIGDFQAVAGPLAMADTRVSAATLLARRAADVASSGAESTDADAAGRTAVASARRAALGALATAHQVLGALGFTREGPLGVLRARCTLTALAPFGGDVTTRAV